MNISDIAKALADKGVNLTNLKGASIVANMPEECKIGGRPFVVFYRELGFGVTSQHVTMDVETREISPLADDAQRASRSLQGLVSGLDMWTRGNPRRTDEPWWWTTPEMVRNHNRNVLMPTRSFDNGREFMDIVRTDIDSIARANARATESEIMARMAAQTHNIQNVVQDWQHPDDKAADPDWDPELDFAEPGGRRHNLWSPRPGTSIPDWAEDLRFGTDDILSGIGQSAEHTWDELLAADDESDNDTNESEDVE